MPIITKTEYVQIVAAQDTTPESFVDFNDNTSQSVGTLSTSNAQTITTITGSVNVSVTGDGSPEVSVNGGTFTSSATTIQNNQTIRVRLTNSTSPSTTHTATVTIGTVSKTFDSITAASGSGGTGAGGGSSDYGVEVYDTDGTTTVLSPSTRYVSFMNDPSTVTVPAKSGGVNGSVFVQQDMTGLTTSNSDILFANFFSTFGSLTITRNTTGAVSTQGITIENSADVSIDCVPIIIRF